MFSLVINNVSEEMNINMNQNRIKSNDGVINLDVVELLDSCNTENYNNNKSEELSYFSSSNSANVLNKTLDYEYEYEIQQSYDFDEVNANSAIKNSLQILNNETKKNAKANVMKEESSSSDECIKFANYFTKTHINDNSNKNFILNDIY